MAADWDATLLELGEVGHMNPASGYGLWPMAQTLIEQLQLGCELS
jgi:predicted alpha/beta hydrolase family esterase